MHSSHMHKNVCIKDTPNIWGMESLAKISGEHLRNDFKKIFNYMARMGHNENIGHWTSRKSNVTFTLLV